ncbi:hypothetical protein DFH09DRAFT_1088085 [Mycena vulgaris]|nr:hypothetical protein DFH09DRAFT_1088085 [Mycena vulgaris]
MPPTIPITGERRTRFAPHPSRQTTSPHRSTVHRTGETRAGWGIRQAKWNGKWESETRWEGESGIKKRGERKKETMKERADTEKKNAEGRSKAHNHLSWCPIAEAKGKGQDGPTRGGACATSGLGWRGGATGYETPMRSVHAKRKRRNALRSGNLH